MKMVVQIVLYFLNWWLLYILCRVDLGIAAKSDAIINYS